VNGGWRLQLLDDGEEVGGAVFPADPNPDPHAGMAWFNALAEPERARESGAGRARVVDVVDPDAIRRAAGKPTRALWLAAKSANVSYSGELTPEELEQALASGEAPDQHYAQLAHVLDEAPLQLVCKVVAEVAAKRHRETTDIWKNLRRPAQALNATRWGLWGDRS